jgi:hypothetical protein
MWKYGKCTAELDPNLVLLPFHDNGARKLVGTP